MTVKQLIERLQKEDPKRIVILQKDPEGNGFSPLSSIWAGAYQAETTWHGKAGLEKLTAEDEASGFSQEDVVRGRKALVLVPVN